MLSRGRGRWEEKGFVGRVEREKFVGREKNWLVSGEGEKACWFSSVM